MDKPAPQPVSKPDLRQRAALWIEEALGYVNDPAMSPSMEREGKELLAALSEQRAEPAPQPSPGSGELPPLTDDRVQAVFKILTSGKFVPFGSTDNWVTWTSRRIVAALAAAPAGSGWSDALAKRRDLLLQAADYLQDDAADSDAGGNNSRAEGCRASIYAIRQIVALVDADAALAAKPVSDAQDCPRCQGSGEREYFDTSRGPDGDAYTDTCNACGGSGEVSDAQDGREAEPVVTEEMVTAYLTANDAYWKRTDELPQKPGKWRQGTPSEATRVSLLAALAAAPQAAPGSVPKPLDDPRLQEAFSSAILGALAFGAQGVNPPPKGHWLTQFWELARNERAAAPGSVPEDAKLAADQARNRRDAARYRWLRDVAGNTRDAGPEVVITNTDGFPTEDFPMGDKLDEAIDAAMGRLLTPQ